MKSSFSLPLQGDFARELQKNAKALVAFEAMPLSHQREYIRAIEEAKKPETRQRRIAGAIETILKWEAEEQNRKKIKK